MTGNRTSMCNPCAKKWRRGLAPTVGCADELNYAVETAVIADFSSEMKIINCESCKEDYGIFPKGIIIGSSIDCPFCAESQLHIRHINGFKLPNTMQMEAMEENMGFYNCSECDEKIHTSQLPSKVCNTCLSEVDATDVIDYPKHYNTGKIQPIDVIEDWNLDFRLASALKYIARHQHKGSAKKDLEKAIWYMERYIEKELNKEGNNG